METEAKLVDDVKRGDRTAMRQLYEQLAGVLMAVAMRYVPDKNCAQDVVQDAFVKIFTSIGQFQYRGKGSLCAWATRITVNMALDSLRHDNALDMSQPIPDVADEPEPDIGGVSDEVLFELIGRLPAGYRVVLNLYVFGQLSHKEIAKKLGIKVSTSASQFFHAKKMLGKMINEYQNDCK